MLLTAPVPSSLTVYYASIVYCLSFIQGFHFTLFEQDIIQIEQAKQN